MLSARAEISLSHDVNLLSNGEISNSSQDWRALRGPTADQEMLYRNFIRRNTWRAPTYKWSRYSRQANRAMRLANRGPHFHTSGWGWSNQDHQGWLQLVWRGPSAPCLIPPIQCRCVCLVGLWYVGHRFRGYCSSPKCGLEASFG